MTKRAYTEREAAFYLGMSARSLRALRADDLQRSEDGEPIQGPAWRRLGTRIRYYQEALDEYLDRAPQLGACESKRTTTSGTAASRRAAELQLEPGEGG